MSSLVTSSRQVYTFFPPLASFFRNVPRYAPLIHLKTQVFRPNQGWADAIALVDCGAQGGIINSNFVQKYSLPLIPKTTPVIYVFADGEGTNDGPSRNYSSFTLRVGNHQEVIALDVSLLHHEDILLGLGWLEKHNPSVDWKNRRLIFHSPQCKRYCNIKEPSYAQAITPRPSLMFLDTPLAPGVASSVASISTPTPSSQVPRSKFTTSSSSPSQERSGRPPEFKSNSSSSQERMVKSPETKSNQSSIEPPSSSSSQERSGRPPEFKSSSSSSQERMVMSPEIKSSQSSAKSSSSSQSSTVSSSSSQERMVMSPEIKPSQPSTKFSSSNSSQSGITSPSSSQVQVAPTPSSIKVPRLTSSRSSLRRKRTNTTKSSSSVSQPHSAPTISLINGVAMSYVLRQANVQVYTLTIDQISEELRTTTSTTNSPDTPPDPDLSHVPEEFHEFADVFSKKEADKLPPHRPSDHRIELVEGAKPSQGPIYNLSPVELEALRKYVDDNLRKGFIKHSHSPFSAPILFVKKADGSLRLCVDYRGLNKITIKNKYPLPLIGGLLESVRGAKRFTKFDARDGFNILRMAPGDEQKTAFRCRYGLFEYNVMPFGLCNAPGSFQGFMNEILHDFIDDFVVVYLDDILIYSKNAREHRRHVRLVLERLQAAGIHLKPSKCVFDAEEINFLGYVINENGVSMDPSKVSSIVSWPKPESVHDVRVFLGFANFYRRFIKNYSRLCLPLTSLLKKGNRFFWSSPAEHAFNALKKAFTTAPVLSHFDPSRSMILEADASNFALGGVASQVGEDGLLHPVAFHSRKFNPAEVNYEIYDKEMFAIVECMDKWRYYFESLGHKTTIYSDHKNLLWFMETKIYNRYQAY